MSIREDIRHLLVAAQKSRQLVLQGQIRDAWRVIHSTADGAPSGLTLDRYGEWLVLCARDDIHRQVAETWADVALEVLGGAGVVIKTLSSDSSKNASRVYAGQLDTSPVRIREDDAVFLCDLNERLATGLYLDLQGVRGYSRQFADGVEVLNLFAYTCAFSVHAALAGATRVTSVDASKKALRRGRENMEASGIDPNRHRWFSDDVRTHLDRAGRRGALYGLVVLDPPGFGRAGRRSFALETELEALVEAAVRVVAPGGTLILSTHTPGIDRPRLDEAVGRAATSQARRCTTLATFGFPQWDHPAGDGPTRDPGEHLVVLVLKFD